MGTDAAATSVERVSDVSRPQLAQRSLRPLQDRSERALAESAAARAQHGVLTLAQLGELGLGPRAVSHRVAVGRLRRIHRGVYAVERVDRRGRWMAAVLACGPHAILSHRSAAALWGLARNAAGRVDVTVPSRGARARAGIAIHRHPSLDRREATVSDGVPATTVARTLLDVAAVGGRREVERAVDRAEQLRVFDLGEVEAVLRRNRGRAGAGVLGDAIAGYERASVTRSEAEERLLALVRRAGLPEPLVNRWLALPDGGGCEADFLWPERRLVVEVDGRAYHSTRAAFVRDRRRDRRLALAGYETRRYAASELVHDSARVAIELRAFLA